MLQEIFLPKLTKLSQGKNVLGAVASSIYGFLWRDTCVSLIQLKACLEQREPISTLKNLNSRKYSFQKLTQFSQGNNVLDAPAFIKDGLVFFVEIHVFFQLS
jgi:hypothetical protein